MHAGVLLVVYLVTPAMTGGLMNTGAVMRIFSDDCRSQSYA